MIKYITLILLLFASPCHAFWQVAGGGGTVAAPSYLLSENFDDSTACGNGVDSNCSGTWTKVGISASTDFTYTTSPAPLEGTNSAATIGTATVGDGWYRSFTAQDTVYFYFIVSPKVRSTGTLASILDSSGNTVMRVVDSGPEFSIYCNDNLQYSTAMANGTTYHVWGDYTKGTGNNASCHLYHSTTSTKPGSPNITATGNATGQAARFFLSKNGSTPEYIFDKIRVSSSDIGSSPQ
jgi:hypothetical protein